MCSVCHKFPCHPRCPNAEEPPVMGYCEVCNEELRKDYEYYIDNEDRVYCSEKCACKYYGIERKDWYDDE